MTLSDTQGDILMVYKDLSIHWKGDRDRAARTFISIIMDLSGKLKTVESELADAVKHKKAVTVESSRLTTDLARCEESRVKPNKNYRKRRGGKTKKGRSGR